MFYNCLRTIQKMQLSSQNGGDILETGLW